MYLRSVLCIYNKICHFIIYLLLCLMFLRLIDVLSSCSRQLAVKVLEHYHFLVLSDTEVQLVSLCLQMESPDSEHTAVAAGGVRCVGPDPWRCQRRTRDWRTCLSLGSCTSRRPQLPNRINPQSSNVNTTVWSWVLPEKYWKIIMETLRGDSGHLGLDKT